MRILGVDTATPIASVALVDDGKLIAQQTHPDDNSNQHEAPVRPHGNHAEIVLALIESVLRKACCSLTELSAIAVSIGPGSFTGLRIGLATVKGLAYGSDIPVVGVSTLLANAARVTDFDGLICSFLDARKNEAYWALFRHSGVELQRLTADAVSSVAAAVEHVGSYPASLPRLVVGNGALAYRELLLNSLGAGVELRAGDRYDSLAAQVARLSSGLLGANEAGALAHLAPVYLRSSAAHNKSKELI